MTWTQLTLTLPGGIRLELRSLYRPPRETRPSTLPPTTAALIETEGESLDNVVDLAERRCA